MKTFTKFFVAFNVALLVSCGSAKVDYSYEHRCIGTGKQGLQIVEVFSYGKTVEQAINASKRNAVHAVLFKGLNCPSGSQPALAGAADAEKHKAYFEEFFRSGKYLQFVTLSGDGSIDPSKRMKIDKGYKVGVDIAIRYNALRDKLEADGIIRKMNAGF